MRLVWATLPLIAVLLGGALIIFLVDRWRKRQQPLETSDDLVLANYRSMYEEGELTREEFERIKEKLTHRLRSELDLPASPTTIRESGRDVETDQRLDREVPDLGPQDSPETKLKPSSPPGSEKPAD